MTNRIEEIARKQDGLPRMRRRDASLEDFKKVFKSFAAISEGDTLGVDEESMWSFGPFGSYQ